MIARMRIAVIVVRLLLGLMFVVFGANAFLQFMPPPEMTGPAGDFIKAMGITGYLQAVAVFQIAGGLLLLFGRVALGLLLLGPIIVNIVLFHVFMERGGIGMAVAVGALALFLLWSQRSAYTAVFKS